MNLYTKIFCKKRFQIEEDNLTFLSSVVSCLANSCYESLDIIRLESLLFFNQNNPYLHQICGKIYFLKENHEKADFHFDKALELNIKDGGWTLTTKALNNMFDTVISYEAVTSLESLFNNEAYYKAQNGGEIQSGIIVKENEYAFSSFYIDMRSKTSLGETCCMMSVCYFRSNLLFEADEYIKKAIQLCPDREDFKKLENDIQISRDEH